MGKKSRKKRDREAFLQAAGFEDTADIVVKPHVELTQAQMNALTSMGYRIFFKNGLTLKGGSE